MEDKELTLPCEGCEQQSKPSLFEKKQGKLECDGCEDRDKLEKEEIDYYQCKECSLKLCEDCVEVRKTQQKELSNLDVNGFFERQEEARQKILVDIKVPGKKASEEIENWFVCCEKGCTKPLQRITADDFLTRWQKMDIRKCFTCFIESSSQWWQCAAKHSSMCEDCYKRVNAFWAPLLDDEQDDSKLSLDEDVSFQQNEDEKEEVTLRTAQTQKPSRRFSVEKQPTDLSAFESQVGGETEKSTEDNRVNYSEMKRNFLLKSTMQQLPLIKSKFVNWFANPLQFSDRVGAFREVGTFFTVQELELPQDTRAKTDDFFGLPKAKEKSLSKVEIFDLAPVFGKKDEGSTFAESIKTEISQILQDLPEKETDPDTKSDFEDVKAQLGKLLENKNSFVKFFDPHRRKLYFKNIFLCFSKDQCGVLLSEIFQKFQENMHAELDEENHELDQPSRTQQERKQSSVLFTEPEIKLEKVSGKDSQESLQLLVKWRCEGTTYTQVASHLINERDCKLFKALTGDFLFYFKSKTKKLVIIKPDYDCFDHKQDQRRFYTEKHIRRNLRQNNMIMIFDKYLLAEIEQKANRKRTIVFLDIEKTNYLSQKLFQMTMAQKDRLYVIPSEKLKQGKARFNVCDLLFLLDQVSEKRLVIFSYNDLIKYYKEVVEPQTKAPSNLRESTVSERFGSDKKERQEQLFSEKKELNKNEEADMTAFINTLQTKESIDYLSETDNKELVIASDCSSVFIQSKKTLLQLKMSTEDKFEPLKKTFSYGSNVMISKNAQWERCDFIVEYHESTITVKSFLNFFKDTPNIQPQSLKDFCVDLANRVEVFSECSDPEEGKPSTIDSMHVIGLNKAQSELRLIKVCDLQTTPRQIAFHLPSSQTFCSYPIVATNFDKFIFVQSFTHPHEVFTHDITQGGVSNQNETFVKFVETKDLSHAGFKDRRYNLFDSTPFQESACRILYLTRTSGLCRHKDKCVADYRLNLLEVDPYRRNISFKLYQSPYEICSLRGMRSDLIIRCFVMQMGSYRGQDFALAVQHRDCLVFTSLTSILHKPGRFPHDHIEYQHKKPGLPLRASIDYSNCGINEGEMDTCAMQMDKEGIIFWLYRPQANSAIQVMRCNLNFQMEGQRQFVHKVYQLHTNYVFAFLAEQDLFYLLDENFEVHILRYDSQFEVMEEVRTLRIANLSKNNIAKRPFDDFVISQSVLHHKDMAYFLVGKTDEADETYREFCMLDEADHVVHGPWNCGRTNMLLAITEEKLLLFPRADKSVIDFLPNHSSVVNEKQGSVLANFTSFEGDQLIVTQYAGQLCVFNLHGVFLFSVSLPSAFPVNRFCFKLNDWKTLFGEKIDDNFAENLYKFRIKTKRGSFAPEEPVQPRTSFKKLFTTKSIPSKTDFEPVKIASKEPSRVFAKITDPKAISTLQSFQVFYQKQGTIDNSELKQAIKQKEGQMVQYNTGLYKPNLKSRVEQYELLHKPSYFKTSNDGTAFKQYVRKHLSLAERQGILVARPPNIKRSGNDKDQATADLDSVFKKIDFEVSTFDNQGDFVQKETVTFDLSQFPAARNLYGFYDKASLDKKLKSERLIDYDLAINDVYQKKVRLIRVGKFLVLKMCNRVFYLSETDPSEPKKVTMVDLEIEELSEDKYVMLDIIETNTDNLFQMHIINCPEHLQYVITWNLDRNKQHNLFQGYFQDALPSLNIVRSHQKDSLNFVFDLDCFFDLRTNVPIQFLDQETQISIFPRFRLVPLDFSYRINNKMTLFLDKNEPGTLHSFVSYTDFLYWERFKQLKTKHELHKNKVRSFMPLLRFPEGKSVFRELLNYPKVIQSVCAIMKKEVDGKRNLRKESSMGQVLMYTNPLGEQTSVLAQALEKELINSFNCMLMLHTEPTRSGNSRFFKEQSQMGKVINNKSQVVRQFFQSSFIITQQFDEPFILKQQTNQELFFACETTFITEQLLQKHVNRINSVVQQQEKPGVARQNDVFGRAEMNASKPRTKRSVKRQVQARVLDLDWISDITGQGDTKKDYLEQFINVLSTTENDALFRTAQIRVFIEYLWQLYFPQILWKLFIPKVALTVSYTLLSVIELNKQDLFWSSMYFVCFIVLMILSMYNTQTEFGQLRQVKLRYFLDFWNIMDLLIIFLISWQIFDTLSALSYCLEVDILAATECMCLEFHEDWEKYSRSTVTCFVLWMTMFYWMRLFRPFASFFRMVIETVRDSLDFFLILIGVHLAFASALVILNKGRVDQRIHRGLDPDANCDPATGDICDIFEQHTQNRVVDAFLQSYLLGLGEYYVDTLDQDHSMFAWTLFMVATVVVQLIFMNLLIAIMSNSFAKIQVIREESVMNELCSLISNYFFIVNRDQIFNGNKYIIWLIAENRENDKEANQTQAASEQMQQAEVFKNRTQQQTLDAIDYTNASLGKLNASFAELVNTIGQLKKQQEDLQHYVAKDIVEDLALIRKDIDSIKTGLFELAQDDVKDSEKSE